MLSSFYKACDPYSCSGDSPRLSSPQQWIWLNLILEVLSHEVLCIHEHLLLLKPKQMIFEQQRKQISPSCLQSKYPKWMSYLYIRLEEDKGHPQQWACDRALWSFSPYFQLQIIRLSMIPLALTSIKFWKFIINFLLNQCD